MTSSRQSGKLFVISSPSGGGKTTIVWELRQRCPELVRSVSVTTRPPRPSERRGVDYRFLSPEDFRRRRKAGGLLEWAKVHGAYYGTPKAPIVRALAKGWDVILSIDVQGARKIRRRFGPHAVLVFLLPPSMADLKRRLIHRRTEPPEVIRRRLRAARQELACVRWYDYAVVNHRLADAIEQVRAIVTAERVRVTRRHHLRSVSARHTALAGPPSV